MILYTNPWLTDYAKELNANVVCMDSDHPDFYSYLKKAQAVVGLGLKVDQKFLDSAPNLKIVSLTSVGYDSVNVALMKERGVLLTNTPDVLTETTADLGFALLMATARRLPEAIKLLEEKKWDGKVPEELFSTDVHGKKLGIIGMGRIGEAIAKRAHFGFDMEIGYFTRTTKKTAFPAKHMTLDDLLKWSDFVLVMAPLSPETRGLIRAREFGLMKKSAILINVARGPIVDESALYEALKNGTIRSAGLDVFEKEPLPSDSPLRSLSNVVMLPHIGSATVATRKAMVKLAMENMQAAMDNKTPKNLVTE